MTTVRRGLEIVRGRLRASTRYIAWRKAGRAGVRACERAREGGKERLRTRSATSVQLRVGRVVARWEGKTEEERGSREKAAKYRPPFCVDSLSPVQTSVWVRAAPRLPLFVSLLFSSLVSPSPRLSLSLPLSLFTSC